MNNVIKQLYKYSDIRKRKKITFPILSTVLENIIFDYKNDLEKFDNLFNELIIVMKKRDSTVLYKWIKGDILYISYPGSLSYDFEYIISISYEISLIDSHINYIYNIEYDFY